MLGHAPGKGGLLQGDARIFENLDHALALDVARPQDTGEIKKT
jgi:hypothetical protein